MVHPADRAETESSWTAATDAGIQFSVEHRLRRTDGVFQWFKTRAVPLLDTTDSGRTILHWFGTSTDIHAVHDAQDRSLFLAHHDDLTGAANRTLLRQTLEAAIQADDGPPSFFVLCIDIDKFKDCNDRVGHRGGDAALREIADRLREISSPGWAVTNSSSFEWATGRRWAISDEISSSGSPRRSITTTMRFT